MGHDSSLGRSLPRWRIRALIVGGCLALAAAAAAVVPVIWDWEEAVDLYLLFQARGNRPAPDNIVLVPINSQAARRLSLPRAPEDFERCSDVRLDEASPDYRHPDPPEVLTRWPRCLHARALEALAVGEPDTVVIDILFRPRSDPSGVFAAQDKALAEAMYQGGRGKVVLAQKLKSDPQAEERPEPVAHEIEEAALGVAPFLVLGERLSRAEKFCTFMETDGWSGPCLPVVAQQATALEHYAQLRALLRAVSEDADLLPESAEALLRDRAVQAPVQLIRQVHMQAPPKWHEAEAQSSADAELARLLDTYRGPSIRYLNFYGPPHAFRTLVYEELVAGSATNRPPAGSLRGKVVFMGFAERERPEQIEHFPTPFTTTDGIKLSGVELAATAFANLADGSSVTPVAPWLRALIVLAFGVYYAIVCAVLPPTRALALCLALPLAYFAVALQLFTQHALWLPLLLPVGLATPAVVGAGLTLHYLELQRQRDRIREAIGKLLPQRVVERIVNSNQKLAQLRESVYGACVFTDAERYTTLAESLPAEQVAKFLDDYFEALFPIVHEGGGEAIDVVGDAMMAVWASPAPDAALRARACRASLQLAAAAERFRATRAGPVLSTRIGVDYGMMSIGMVGTPFHEEYRPIGDVPNTASRLQDLNKQLGTRLLVSEAVIAGLDAFLVRDLGHFTLRGRERLTRVYELIGERVRATPSQLDLCAAFAEALGVYQAGERDAARALFETLLERHPADGPAAFYARMCTERRALPEGHAGLEIIQASISSRTAGR